MGYREDCIGWYEGEQGHAYRPRHVSRPPCGDRRWPGSHIACVLNAEHEGEHESAEGDRWADAEASQAETREPRFPPPVNPFGPGGKPPRPQRSRRRGNPRTWGQR